MKKIILAIVFIALILGAYFAKGIFFKSSDNVTRTPGQALDQLIQGHQRYLENKNIHRDQYAEQRAALTSKQEPMAVILGCSDSRVEPAIVFDQGLGDLFVIRIAGNVCDDLVLGSIEYAVKVLHVPLIMVIGHEKCGAVEAAIKAASSPVSKSHVATYIDSIVQALMPVVNKIAHENHPAAELLDIAVRQNAKHVGAQISEQSTIVQQAIKKNKLQIVCACYDIETGRVELLS